MSMSIHTTLDVHSRRPGRPRSARADRAILDAALSLLVEQGIDGMSIEEVAERAGVGKATIYRRWPSKEELVLAAVCCIDETFELPDTGSVRGDFRAMLDAKRIDSDSAMWSALARVIGEAISNPELMEVYRETILEPRRRAATAIIERGKARGEVRPDADTNMLIDMIGGFIMYRLLVEHVEPIPSPDQAERIIELVCHGIAATPN